MKELENKDQRLSIHDWKQEHEYKKKINSDNQAAQLNDKVYLLTKQKNQLETQNRQLKYRITLLQNRQRRHISIAIPAIIILVLIAASFSSNTQIVTENMLTLEDKASQRLKEKIITLDEANQQLRKIILYKQKLTHIANQLNAVGNNFVQIRDYNKALKYFNKSLQINKQLFGQEHINTAVSYKHIGKAYDASEDHEKALEEYKKALQIRKNIRALKDQKNLSNSETQIINQDQIETLQLLVQMQQEIIKFFDQSLKSKILARYSSILTRKQDFMKLYEIALPLKILYFKLLFKASQHNFCVTQFHKKCDGIPHTVTIVKTKKGGKIIGGYTQQKWQSIENGQFVSGDGSSFLFSLTNMHKLTNTDKGRSIYNFQKYGPSFGSNGDLRIANQSNIKGGSFAYIGGSYKNEAHYPKGQHYSWQRFSGYYASSQFLTEQWQVYEVIFQ